MSKETEERAKAPTAANPDQLSRQRRVGAAFLVRRAADWFWVVVRATHVLQANASKSGVRSKSLNWRVALVWLLAAAAIPIWRATTGQAKPQIVPAPLTLSTVAASRVVRADLYNEVTIPAEFRPYAEVELHAKVSGFVQRMFVDIGDEVKAGQLLAKLEVPELKDDLDRAQAALKRAEADYQDAHLVYTRLQAVDNQHPNLVAQQELDTAEAKDHTAQAAIAAAKAEVEKNETLLNYTRITAPFDGVITHRYADPGALVQAGTTSQTQSLPLVRLSDNYRLRLDFPVSVGYVKDIRPRAPVEVRVESIGGRSFEGLISRWTHKVNEETRTMTTEVEVPNPKLELVPGMYAKVVLKVEKRSEVLSIPTEAVSGGREAKVYVINQRDEIEERPVTLGLETPTRYEVTSGLKEGELVLIGSHSGTRPGQRVEARVMDSSVQ